MWSDINLDQADADGLIAIGGDLGMESLLDAYRHGIFPWYDEESPICWWSPDPRAIFELDQFHIPRRLLRTCRSGKFQLTVNQAFTEVIRGCADREEGTWITSDMMAAYERLHHAGFVHSVEAWYDGDLAGGVYGVAIGGFFAAESMFYRYSDASKVALVHLHERLYRHGFELFDTQMVTPTTLSFGAVEIARCEYLRRLRLAVAKPISFLEE